MSSKWTTEDVRACVRLAAMRLGAPASADIDKLDAWLAAHDAEVAAKELEDAADEHPGEMTLLTLGFDTVADWLRARAAALRGGQ